MRRTRRVLIGLPLVLVGLYIPGWFIGAEVIKGQIDARLQAMQQQGYDVSVDALAVEGFPTRFDVTLDGYSLAAPGGLAGQGESVRAGASVIEFLSDRVIGFEAAAAQTVALPGVPPLTVQVGNAGGEVRLAGYTDMTPETADLVAQDIIITLPAAGAGAPQVLTLAEARAVQAIPLLREDGQPDPDFGGLSVTLREIALPDGMGRGLPDLIDALDADLAIAQPWPARLSAGTLAAWRQSGGTVEVRRFHLSWGEVELTATGTLGLDAELQPEGRLEATVVGMDQLVQAVTGGGDGGGGFGSLSLGLFGGGDGVTLPLTISGGSIGLGPVPLATLPRIVWPE